MLQTRTGKRTGAAAVKIAVRHGEGAADRREDRDPAHPREHLTQLLLPILRPQAKKKADLLTKGLPASPGAASASPAFTADEAVERAAKRARRSSSSARRPPRGRRGHARRRGHPDRTGGMTSTRRSSRAAGASAASSALREIQIDAAQGQDHHGQRQDLQAGDLSIDGTTGEVISARVPTRPPSCPATSPGHEVGRQVPHDQRPHQRRHPEDASKARDFGAEGIGLTRTEHMFFEGEPHHRHARDDPRRDEEAQEGPGMKLLPFQREDFDRHLQGDEGLPVTIRLLDPPLHEFLPHDDARARRNWRRSPWASPRRSSTASTSCTSQPDARPPRLPPGITYPEILEMQVRAIVEAAIECDRKKIKVLPEIMIPLVGTSRNWPNCGRRSRRPSPQVKEEKYKPSAGHTRSAR
jgi:pyruvate,orthophosphate dikinase